MLKVPSFRLVNAQQASADSAAGRRSLLALALLATGMVLAGAVGLIVFSWHSVNRQEAERERFLVQRGLERELTRVVGETRSDAAWDEAYAKTSGTPDPVWMDLSIAGYYGTTFGHDVSLVFNRNGAPGYIAVKQRRADLARFPDLVRTLTPLVRQVQADELKRRGQWRMGQAGANADPQSSVGAVIRHGSDVYLLGVTTIAPSVGFAKGDQPAAVAISGRLLDHRFLASLNRSLGILSPGLADAAPAKLASFAATDPSGAPVRYITWRRDQPGFAVLARAGGWIAAAMALTMLTAALLAHRIRRLFLRLEANDRALEATLAELTEARDQAQAASLAKSQFLANMSHEIRTPLNGVLGMAQALERDALTPEQHDRVQTIRRSGKALLAILNDVIDLSRVEAGKLDITQTEFDMADLVESVLDTYRDVAAAKDVALTHHPALSAQGMFLGDALRVRQILLNLVSNAVKFTDAGRVEVDVSATDAGVAITVADQGVGIAPEDLSHLFEKFSQVDGSADRRFDGAGLGLAICRELTELMGGTITVESEPGTGSTFTVALPLARARTGAVPADRPPVVEAAAPRLDRPIRILAADDNETNRRVLQVLLEPLGAEIVMTTDGAGAVAAFRAESFDIVLMDVQMPGVNGVAATRMIREIELREGREHTPILALSANVMVHQLEEYAAAGMDGHVGKPIEVDRLYEALSTALDGTEAALTDRAVA